MKRLITITLAAILAASAITSCTSAPAEAKATSSGYADEAWLKSRLGALPDGVTVGTADELGLDMSDFENDGYFIRTENGETVIAGKSANGLDLAVRKYAKQVKDGVTFDVTYHEGARIERLTVAGRDISEYTVAYTHTGEVRLPNVGKTLGNGEYAAGEFVRLIKEATGITLPMLDLSGGTALPEHYILFEAVEGDTFAVNGYEYKVENGSLVFRGNPGSAGVSNGVYHFVEHVLGWAGMTWGDAILAEAEHIDVPADLYKKGELMFEHFTEAHCDGDPLRSGRDTGYQGYVFHACHGMYNSKFLGDDINYWTEQPCTTDEYTYEMIRDNVVAYIERRLAQGYKIGVDLTYIDLAHNDNDNFCNCKDCRAVYKEDGSQSGPWLRMVNRVSEEVNEIYPGLRYLMFAYQATKCPPRVTKPNDLVNITFCMDGMCYNHSLDSGECLEPTFRSGGIKNDTYCEWIKAWVDMTEWVDIWYYAMDGSFAQYDIYRELFDDVKFFKSVGVRGMYMEGEHYGLGTARLNHEMLPVLQWDPDITWDEYEKRAEGFIERDYGEYAVPAFRAAQNLIRASAHASGCETCWYLADFGLGHADYSVMGERMEGVLEKLDGMIEDAPSRTAEIRGKRLSLCILYEGIVGRYLDAVKAGDEPDLDRLNELYELFCTRGTECGYDMNNFPLGYAPTRRIAPTLAEEAELWTKARYS